MPDSTPSNEEPTPVKYPRRRLIPFWNRWFGVFLAAGLAGSVGTSTPVTAAESLTFERATQTVPQLADPTGAVFDAEGRLFVVESGAHRVRVLNRSGELIREWGAPGLRPSQFLFPADIDLHGTEVFVSDSGNGRVQVFSLDGRFLRAIGEQGHREDALLNPQGIAVTESGVFIADAGRHCVRVFDLEGEAVRSFGSYGVPTSSSIQEPPDWNSVTFIEPSDAAVDRDGNIFVCDSGNHRIVRINQADASILSWGGRGSEPGLFSRPTRIALHSNHLYVADHENHRVQVFTREGEYVAHWGLHAQLPHEEEGKLHYPGAIAIESTHESRPTATIRAAILEPFENRIQFFTHDGEQEEVKALPGAPRQSSHFGERCSAFGSLLAVTEMERGTIAVYDLRGQEQPILTTRFGGYGDRIDQLRRPSGVALASKKRIYVCDPASRKLNVYRHTFDPKTDPRFQPRMVRFVKSLDWARFHAATPELENEPIPQPESVHYDGQGRLYFLDRGTATILVLDESLRYLTHWGERGRGRGQILSPSDITVSHDGAVVYVLDRGGQRVHAFEPDGKPLYMWGRSGTELGKFLDPFGIAYRYDRETKRESVFVSDRRLHQVTKFDGQGSVVGRWGNGLARSARPSERMAPESLFKPTSMVVSIRTQELIVLDFGNHRMQMSPGRTAREVRRQGGSSGPFRMFGAKGFLSER